MNWTTLETANQITDIKQQQGYSAIFKHSTRCSISMMVKKRFELDWDKLPESLPLYYLDLIKYRDLSHQVANDFEINHESPQLLLIKNGECILDLSHSAVTVEGALAVIAD